MSDCSCERQDGYANCCRAKALERMIETRNLWVEDLQAKLSAVEKERDSLKSKLAVAVEALTSIASPHIGKSREESYWLSLPQEACAEVLATDVKIAREALKAINGGE